MDISSVCILVSGLNDGSSSKDAIRFSTEPGSNGGEERGR